MGLRSNLVGEPGVALGALAAAAAFIAPTAASAQDGEPFEREVIVGLGVQLAPPHIGAEDHQIFPMPYVEVLRPGEPMPYSAGDDNPAIALIRTEKIQHRPHGQFPRET